MNMGAEAIIVKELPPEVQGIDIPGAVPEAITGLFTGPKQCAVAPGSCTVVEAVFQGAHETGCMPVVCRPEHCRPSVLQAMGA